MLADLTISCGSSATDDRASATIVLNQYCNPATTLALPTPTANIISQYAWELPEFSNLAPCAASAVSYALDDASYKCPKDASLWGPCICTKAGFANTLSSGISSFAQSTCSNGEDATSAVNYYSNYCNLNKGTSSFALPAKPPGDSKQQLPNQLNMQNVRCVANKSSVVLHYCPTTVLVAQRLRTDCSVISDLCCTSFLSPLHQHASTR